MKYLINKNINPKNFKNSTKIILIRIRYKIKINIKKIIKIIEKIHNRYQIIIKNPLKFSNQISIKN